VAILSVLMFHLGGEVNARGPKNLAMPRNFEWLNIVQGNGDRGVVLFFVISGYILARPFLREHRLEGHPVKLGRYFLRRLTRLEPPYILSLLIFTFAEWQVNHVALRTLLPHLLASLTYTHNVIYSAPSLISFVTWSLEIEVQFYILAPLLGNLYRIEKTALRRATIAVLMGVMGIVSMHLGDRMHGTLLGYAQYFLAGFLLADLLEYPRHAPRQHWLWDVVSVAAWGGVFFLPKGAFVMAWLPLVIIPAYLAAFYGRVSNWFFRQPFVALTGGMCYSIYLLHMLVISTAFRVVKHLHGYNDGETMLLQQVVLLLPLVLLVGAVYFVLIERPCMDPEWPQKLWRRLRGAGQEL